MVLAAVATDLFTMGIPVAEKALRTFAVYAGVLLLLVFNAAMVRVARSSETAVRLFEGEPTEIVRDGRLVDPAMHRLALRRADVENAVRRQGATSLSEVASATIEPGGSIVVQLRDASMPATKEDVTRLEAKLDALLASR